jgi:hypothetical protein
VTIADATPLWPAEWTAIGTLTLAAVTVAAIVTSILITRQDRKRADKRLADERSAADKRLAGEIQAADERLKAQQEHADKQFRTEQWRITEREQYTEAYAVQVTMGEAGASPGPSNEYGDPGADAAKILAAMVVNRGQYAITDVSAQFSPDGRSLIPPHRTVPLSGFARLPEDLRAGFRAAEDNWGNRDTLGPGDGGIRFETDPVGLSHLAGPYFVVRWVDRWETRWEYKKGVVRYLTGNEQWLP